MADERRALREFAGYHACWAGRSYLRAGDYERARSLLLRAIGERPDGDASGSIALIPGEALDLLLDSASCRGRVKDVKRAIAAYGEAFGDDEVRSTPGDGPESMVTARSLWSFHLARALIRSGELSRGRDMLRSSMDSISGSAWITVEPDEERVLMDLREAAEDL